jgi:two-component system, OmpR family, response regulator
MSISSQLKILVVDDDPEIRTLLASYMGSQGMLISEASTESELLTEIISSVPDVVLLDVNLGSEDGFSIARRLRQRWQGGLIMLTGRGDTIDRVVGLEIGADDYVAKPFDLRELLARVRSVGRRSVKELSPETLDQQNPIAAMNRIMFDRFTLVLEARELRDDQDEVIALTSGEFDLLAALIKNSGRVMSRDSLLQMTHHREAGPFDRTIDVQIGRLRRKLGDDSNPPRAIKSVRGQGYLFALEVRKES